LLFPFIVAPSCWGLSERLVSHMLRIRVNWWALYVLYLLARSPA
jgi:hypothetical protein